MLVVHSPDLGLGRVGFTLTGRSEPKGTTCSRSRAPSANAPGTGRSPDPGGPSPASRTSRPPHPAERRGDPGPVRLRRRGEGHREAWSTRAPPTSSATPWAARRGRSSWGRRPHREAGPRGRRSSRPALPRPPWCFTSCPPGCPRGSRRRRSGTTTAGAATMRRGASLASPPPGKPPQHPPSRARRSDGQRPGRRPAGGLEGGSGPAAAAYAPPWARRKVRRPPEPAAAAICGWYAASGAALGPRGNEGLRRRGAGTGTVRSERLLRSPPHGRCCPNRGCHRPRAVAGRSELRDRLDRVVRVPCSRRGGGGCRAPGRGGRKLGVAGGGGGAPRLLLAKMAQAASLYATYHLMDVQRHGSFLLALCPTSIVASGICRSPRTTGRTAKTCVWRWPSLPSWPLPSHASTTTGR